MNPYDVSLNTKYKRGYFQNYGSGTEGYKWLNYYDNQGNFKPPKIDTNQHITYNPDNFGSSLNQDPYKNLNLTGSNGTTVTNASNNTGSKLGNIISGISAGIEPTAALIGSMMDRNYKNPMKYAELDNYANQGNVDSFEALENVYANLDKAPTASKMDFNGINGKGWFDNFLKDTTAGVSLGTSIAPGWGTLIGAVAGAANGLIRSGIQAGKSNKAYNDYLLAQERANERLMANLNNSYHNAAMNEYNNLLSNMAAFGGKLNRFDMGGDISNGVNLIDSGSTHELNPYEGVQQGVDSQGIPNMVEEGEVVWEDEDYVFSNRLTVPKMPKKKADDETKEEKFNRLYEGKTFAEVAERLQRESKERPTSSISKDTMNDNLSMLRDLQEEVKMKQQADEFRQEINSMSPEELMGLQQMLGAMGQQGMEQPIPEQMPEQLPQERMMPQGMPDMGIAVNPAMIGQPMMACGGRLHKYGYGGNMFAFGGPDGNDYPLLDTSSASTPVPIQEYIMSNYPNSQDLYLGKSLLDRLNYRGRVYSDMMNSAVNNSEYIPALNYVGQGTASGNYWNDLISGNTPYKQYEDFENSEIRKELQAYKDNCITSTQVMDKRTHEQLIKELKAQRKDLEKFLAESGKYSSKEINDYLDNIEKSTIENRGIKDGNIKDTLPIETGIVKFQQLNNYDYPNNYYTLEVDDYTDEDMKKGGKLYNLLKDLPTGTTLGWGYNNKDTKKGFYSPAHYTMLDKTKDGEVQIFNGNDSDFYNRFLKGEASLDDKGKGAAFKTVDWYKGYNAKNITDKANKDGYTQNGEPLTSNSRRLMIQIPILGNSNINEYDYLASRLAYHHNDIGLKKVNWRQSEDGSYRKQEATPIEIPKDNGIVRMETQKVVPIQNTSDIEYVPSMDKYFAMSNIDNNLLAYANGGSIYIKPENRGKFTALKERTGKSSTWYKEYGTPEQKKMATFALNAAKWKHNNGGMLNKFDGGGYYLADSINPYTYYSPYNILGANIGDTSLPIVIDKVPEAPKDNSFLGTEIITSPIGSYGLDVTHPNYTDYSPKPPKAPKVKKTHPWWNDQWNNFKTAVTNEDWRLHAPEYATALGLAHEYLRDKSKDFAEEVNFARHITEPNISYRPTGTMAPYRPESSLAVLDRLSAMSAASRNSLMNLSNASRAAKAMYNAMNDMRYFDALGQMDRQLREQNNTNYLKNLEFNNALAAQNAMGDLQAASTNAQLKNSQLASWAHLMDTLNAEALQRDTAKGAMATHLPELISEHAKDEIKNKMLKEMAEKGSLLYYWDPRYQMNYSGNNTTALGGYIDVRPLDKRTKKNRK